MTIGSLLENGRTIASLVDVTDIKQMQGALTDAHNKLRLLTGITILETGVPGKGVRFEMTVSPGEYRIVT